MRAFEITLQVTLTRRHELTSPSSDHPATVRDNTGAGQFEIDADGELAFLRYRRRRGLIVLVHTEVPPALAGRGFGGVLAKHALERARSEGLRVYVICPFVKAWLQRHPEYADMVRVAPG